MTSPDEDYWSTLVCWNGLSTDQQGFLMDQGVLPFGRWKAEGGTCPSPAEVGVTTRYDEQPGPRFYCVVCAIEYLKGALP